MSSSRLLAIVALALLVCTVSGQLDYQKKNYVPPKLSGATTCVKPFVGSTPALCPQDKGVPLTDEGKPGSTTCVTGVDGKDYEGVISLMYPAPNAVPWCTSNAQCGSTEGIICAASGPTGSGNMCFPLAPATCPFGSEPVTRPTPVAAAGRRLMRN